MQSIEDKIAYKKKMEKKILDYTGEQPADEVYKELTFMPPKILDYLRKAVAECRDHSESSTPTECRDPSESSTPTEKNKEI
jgi:hypothetical protein